MGALLEQYRAAGIDFTTSGANALRALGQLTDELRATIRANKSAILAELAANDCATPEQAAELRRLVPAVCRLIGEPDVAGALATALADPDAALTCFRALHADRQPVAPDLIDDPTLRSCRQCANLTPAGRCLAARRQEPFGAGIAILTRDYSPTFPDRGQRCGAYAPGPADPDRRSGRERWPFLFPGPDRARAERTRTPTASANQRKGPS